MSRATLEREVLARTDNLDKIVGNKRPHKPANAKQREILAKARAKKDLLLAQGLIKVGRSPSLKTLQKLADKDAREKFLAFASTHVLPIGDALVQRAKAGDVQAMKEFFDRTWGKAPVFIAQTVQHTFSLRDLHNVREGISPANDATLNAIKDMPSLDELTEA